MKRAACAAALVVAAAGLAACGGETVDSSDVTSTSSAPSAVTSSVTSSVTSTSSVPTTTATHTATATAATSSPAADAPAREVTSAPNELSYLSDKERAYLTEVRDKGVNVDGIEDQLTATGYSICGGTTVTRDAVAGQLGEQGRTTMDAAAAASLIDATARAHLC
ncbi:hypothetical protein CAPI_08775 [Corynebacterium capitovis DSM 44611]|uniref:hypothetical protein n=1 Tax=Corynebacterium capitovis TaxID=131081 RepID=UPI000364E86A|nr:hypothetical protein [Corynebacterium capitovis]WKD58281.1 hypothetical protein CAPI_08775 [Corynebacterium capitovis DSM 44611]